MSSVKTEQATEKHDRILSEAIRIFAREGFQSTDVQVIANQAEVGKGTIYRYFGSKEELFLAAADFGMKQLETTIFSAIERQTGSYQVLRTIAITYACFFQKHPELVEIMIQERAQFRKAIPETHLVYRQKNRGVIEKILETAKEKGELRPINVKEATNAFTNLLFGTIVCATAKASSATHLIVPMIESAFELYWQGIKKK